MPKGRGSLSGDATPQKALRDLCLLTQPRLETGPFLLPLPAPQQPSSSIRVTTAVDSSAPAGSVRGKEGRRKVVLFFFLTCSVSS